MFGAWDSGILLLMGSIEGCESLAPRLVRALLQPRAQAEGLMFPPEQILAPPR